MSLYRPICGWELPVRLPIGLYDIQITDVATCLLRAYGKLSDNDSVLFMNGEWYHSYN